MKLLAYSAILRISHRMANRLLFCAIPLTMNAQGGAPIVAPSGFVGIPYRINAAELLGSKPEYITPATAALKCGGGEPAGLAVLDNQGNIGGMPQCKGEFLFWFQIASRAPSSSETGGPTQRGVMINVLADATAADAQVLPLQPATVNANYVADLGTLDLKEPNYALLSPKGSLPRGLNLDGYRGLLRGVPRETGRFKFMVRLTASSQPAEDKFVVYSLDVTPGSAQSSSTGAPPAQQRVQPPGLRPANLPKYTPKPSKRPCTRGDKNQVELWEVRGPDRRDEYLNVVDGLNLDRDIDVVFCSALLTGFRESPPVASIRAWVDTPDHGWKEIALQELSARITTRLENMGGTLENVPREPAVVVITTPQNDSPEPHFTIPLRKIKVKEEDRVRITVHIEDVKLLDHTLHVGKFGLHRSFSDSLLFINRLGDDNANRADGGGKDRLGNPVLFDSVSFRPAVGLNYGFTFYKRRSAFLQFLEPGFGASFAIMSWEDRSLAAPPTYGTTPLQVGVGVMGSMFENAVIGSFGWNLQTKDHRTYVSIGVSVTGLVRKIAKTIK